MIIVWAIAIYRRASLPTLTAMQRRVLAETMIMADCGLPLFHRCSHLLEKNLLLLSQRVVRPQRLKCLVECPLLRWVE